MIEILHISAECFPAAKTGGLADVVGALPKYMTQAGVSSSAIIPKYDLKWIKNQTWETVHSGEIRLDWRTFSFEIQRHADDALGFPFFVVHIPGLFDRPGIYADPTGRPYSDEVERYIGFQQAVLRWLLSFPNEHRPRLLHCHDHHTGLIPFMINHCIEFKSLGMTPTVFTIHNGQYQGAFSWSKVRLLPAFDQNMAGFLDWKNTINPMASAIKLSWAVTTVSKSYLGELHQSSLGLEPLFWQEWRKQHGIINGIDADVWDPATDEHLSIPYKGNIPSFKLGNKKSLCTTFGLNEDLPLVSFIGRMVGEKGADLLPNLIRKYLAAGGQVNFFILGSGEEWTENEISNLSQAFPGRVNCYIGYSEPLAHLVYAASDFLIMPSRVEPCGLNQLYSMRYGTIPIVRSIGGLKDTVPDIADPSGEGRGIRFDNFNVDDAFTAILRASELFQDKKKLALLRKNLMNLNFSWEKTIEQYFEIYRSFVQ